MVSAHSDFVGQYELLRLLGHGGYCAVYEARDRSSGERVALKQLRRLGPASLSSFRREFRTVQGLHHPNLVELRELFEAGGRCFIAMELVQGVDLVSHLRPGDGAAGCDPTSVRSVFAQLVCALAALHAAGVIHRDLKPHNVIVTPKGRAVLLDFGLVKSLDAELHADDAGLGSAVYMAPEQAIGAAISPAADYYALGVCLYEALTGTTPFQARSPHELLQIKQHAVPAAPSARTAGTVSDFDALCLRLLDPVVANRPLANEVLRVFEAPDAAPSLLPAAQLEEEFAGRADELERLAAGFADSCAGELVLLLVQGESGIGKSALVARFLSRVQRDGSGAWVVRSRCYENEWIAYKAFDGGMEQLARALARLERTACELLLPPGAALLPRLFSAFASVPAIADAPVSELPADPAAQGLAARSALVGLLANLARERPLVLSMDDLQWADAESFQLLRALAEHPAPPALLLIATMQTAGTRANELGAALAELEGWPCTRLLPLEGLPRAEARALAARLLGDGARPSLIEALVGESGGHPLLLSELARYAEGRRGGAAGRRVRLDDALLARIEDLAPAAEQLLSACALAARPYPAQVFASALALAPEDVNGLAAELLAAKLLRRKGGHELACFHDRIRAVAQARLGHERSRELHRLLASALACQPAPDPFDLARHYDSAGQLHEASRAYADAAAQAAAALAFDRAERLYARASILGDQAGASALAQSELQIARGRALACAGRSAEAAELFLQAAPQQRGESQIRLRLLAAQHLLQSARVTEGMRAARALLEELDVPMPSSLPGALARLSWDRAWLALHRTPRTAAAARETTLQDRMRLDALWGLAMPVSWVEPLTSAAISTRHLRLARALGEPSHMARALADESFTRCMQNGADPEVDVLIAQARALSDASQDPVLEVSTALREATIATFRWELPRARERLERALSVATERCPDQPWLLTNIRTTLLNVWASTGEHGQLARCAKPWLAEAHARNDTFALTMLEAVGVGSIRHLMQGDPEQASSALTLALAPWPREPFSFAHLGELINRCYIGLYRGGDAARAWLVQEEARLSGAFMLKLNVGRAAMLTLRASAALAARMAAGADRTLARALLSEARADVRRLAHVKSKLAELHALALSAQLHALDGEPERALALTLEVRSRCAGCGYGLLDRSMEHFQGALEPGPPGRARQESARAFFAAEGWTQPERAIAMLCPVMAELEMTR